MHELQFAGTERFEVVRPIGRGGMGVVYEAIDHEQQARVALKTLRRLTPDALLRFKYEFRSVQDVQHPNLVTLGGLFESDGQWFFTMELVEGVDFLHYVWRGSGDAPSDPEHTASLAAQPDATVETQVLAAGSGRGSAAHANLDEARLRDALRQLAAALGALHRAGKVHRDVKPSNVIIAPGGRLVLLDFGVVADMRRDDDHDDDSRVVGTVAYMPPEQAVGLRAGPPADWYSMGVMLFQALTGTPPFHRQTVAQVSERRIAPLPSRLVPDVPRDLDELCEGLLQFQPEDRPPTAHIFQMLGVDEPTHESLSHSHATYASPFIGRDRELGALAGALAACRAERVPIPVVVHGESGVGKSALVRQFLQLADPDVVTLSGRCYERESVPYRAFDGVMDSLCTYLSRMDQVEAALALPPQIGLVARVFPVLRRVTAVRKAETGPAEALDPLELRARAFRALRELFARMAERRTLVVFIDDFQWANADSLALLRDLLPPPGAPPMLLLLTVRAAAGREVRSLDAAAVVPDARFIELGGLSLEESTALASTIAGALGSRGIDPAAVAREAGGHPLFLQELVHHIGATGGSAEGMAKLDDALLARIHRLDAPARRFLQVLAVAGAPLPLQIAASAAGLDVGDAAKLVLLLRHERLARANGTRARDRVETFHDRVREALVGDLDDGARRDLHAQLADALEGADAELRDPHMLVGQLEAAGATARAAQQAERAAALLEDLLAFEQAAALYRTALRLGVHTDDDRRRLQARLGQALVNCGRCPDAAEAFLAAAEGANDAERLDFRRRAAEQDLISGHIDRGLQQLRSVLAEAGLRLPATPTRALASLLWHRARLRVRGLRWKPRDPSRIPPRDLERLDLHRSVALGLSFVDNIRGAGFQARGLLLALRLGERTHVARAILLEAGYRATQGASQRARLEPLLAEGSRIAREAGDAYLEAWALGVTGVCDYLTGEFSAAERRLREAERLWVTTLPGATWELNHLRILWLLSLRRMGMFRELGQLYDDYRRDAARRGDRLAETTIARALNQMWLARDEPARGRDELQRSAWTSETGFLHLQNWYEIESRIELDLYEGRVAEARDQVEARLAQVGGSLLMRIQTVRTAYWYLCGRYLLAGGASSEVVKLARRLEREDRPYATAWAKLLRAGHANQHGDAKQAMQLLREAVLLGEEHHLHINAAAARRRLGQLLGSREGEPLLHAADTWMQREGIQNPARMTALFTPGLDPR